MVAPFVARIMRGHRRSTKSKRALRARRVALMKLYHLLICRRFRGKRDEGGRRYSQCRRRRVSRCVRLEPLNDRSDRFLLIHERIASNVALYEANAQASGGDTRLPQIVIGNTLVRGTIRTADELFELLARQASGGG